MPRKVRDYKAEYEKYHAKPEQKKNRAARGRARYMLEKEGVVSKGDGKDVDHVRALSKGGAATKRSNLRVQSASENRSYARNKDGSIKSRKK